MASPKGREVNWNTCGKTLGMSLSLGGWGCEGKCSIGLSTIPIPLMDSGVSILNFSMCRKVLSGLKSTTGLHLW